MAEDSPISLHSITSETQDVLSSLLTRLLQHLQRKGDNELVQPSDQEDSSSASNYVLDSDTETLSDGENADSKRPYRFLRVIDTVITRLYRLSNLQRRLRQDKPLQPGSLRESTPDIDFTTTIQSHVKGRYFEFPAGAVLRRRLIGACKARNRRSNSSLSDGENQAINGPMNVLLGIVQSPTDEMIKRWDNLTFPSLPERTGQCPFCAAHLGESIFQQENLWKQHVLEDACPYICLYPHCAEPNQRFTSTDDWLEHMAFAHNSNYYCQVPGHESVSFSTSEELAAHLDRYHSNILPSGQIAAIATRCKYAGSTPLVPLLREWNEDYGGHYNFTSCVFCDKLLLHLPGVWSAFSSLRTSNRLPTGARLQNLSLDTLGSSIQEYNTVAGIIINHLAQHLEEIALMSMPDISQTAPDPIPASGPSNALKPIGSSPSKWVWSPEFQRSYRWQVEDGKLQYQWKSHAQQAITAYASGNDGNDPSQQSAESIFSPDTNESLGE
ncbi:hypothetical protein K491DRAFT_692008 [Lophiostoma macrostomum CBS 122681]|uniref:C2H2-type domain-containing protein n=1 Tax=Lophiostoma macrostomum CBS 122681 TaxID=1314788 RepID=A0A6A6TC23_9PLEO|nr:hypothetical protein K491DRAFT_692008 [Lophiostoma macrostomum CBS 122681]